MSRYMDAARRIITRDHKTTDSLWLDAATLADWVLDNHDNANDDAMDDADIIEWLFEQDIIAPFRDEMHSSSTRRHKMPEGMRERLVELGLVTP